MGTKIGMSVPAPTDAESTLLATGVVTAILLIAVPAVVFGMLPLTLSLIARARESGWDARPGPGFTPVDPVIAPSRRRRAARRWCASVLATVVWVTLLIHLALRNEVILFGVWLFFGPLVFPAFAWLISRMLFPRDELLGLSRPERVRGAPLVRALSGRVMAAAGVLVLWMPFSLFGFATLLRLLNAQTPAIDMQTAAETNLASGDPMTVLIGAIFALNLHAEPPVYLGIAVVAIVSTSALAYFMSRWGRRLRQGSLDAVVKEDTRPHVLYLRGFDEDGLRIRASFTKVGVIDSLMPFGRPRFEELIARCLARVGPVIAISARAGGVPDLGAAKISFSGDEWQQHVVRWMAGARVVVMSVTPAEVHEGLKWEIGQLAERSGGPPIMLVVAPWPRRDVTRRYLGFLAAASRWPLFGSLAAVPFPDGVQVLTWSPTHRWRAYGARRRWDWSYAASMLAAMDDAVPGWKPRRVRVGERTRA